MNDKQLFYALASSIERQGIKEFLSWLENETDYFTAPASTKYHGNEEGGLLRHSMYVYYNLIKLASGTYTRDTLAIVSLFHDICKTNFYILSSRNVKDEETGKWNKVPCYTVSEEYPFGGHGSKSVYLIITHGLKLTDEEAAAINCHMGGWDSTNYSNPSGAFAKYPLAVYLHVADMLASYIDNS